jgi:hypothetical protein
MFVADFGVFAPAATTPGNRHDLDEFARSLKVACGGEALELPHAGLCASHLLHDYCISPA